MEHFDVSIGPDHDITLTDQVGHDLAFAHPDGLGYTITDASGATVGYDHPFGGVDHFLDSQMHEIGTLDPLGTLHSASGETAGHLLLTGDGADITDVHERIVARLTDRFDV